MGDSRTNPARPDPRVPDLAHPGNPPHRHRGHQPQLPQRPGGPLPLGAAGTPEPAHAAQGQRRFDRHRRARRLRRRGLRRRAARPDRIAALHAGGQEPRRCGERARGLRGERAVRARRSAVDQHAGLSQRRHRRRLRTPCRRPPRRHAVFRPRARRQPARRRQLGARPAGDQPRGHEPGRRRARIGFRARQRRHQHAAPPGGRGRQGGGAARRVDCRGAQDRRRSVPCAARCTTAASRR